MCLVLYSSMPDAAKVAKDKRDRIDLLDKFVGKKILQIEEEPNYRLTIYVEGGLEIDVTGYKGIDTEVTVR